MNGLQFDDVSLPCHNCTADINASAWKAGGPLSGLLHAQHDSRVHCGDFTYTVRVVLLIWFVSFLGVCLPPESPAALVAGVGCVSGASSVDGSDLCVVAGALQLPDLVL